MLHVLIVPHAHVVGTGQVVAQIHEWSEADDGASLAQGFSMAFAE